jgi:protein-L-isoaspartate(D-aspartate) O-methyltransferase
MVESHIMGRGVRDERVLAAMRRVPRERFVPETQIEFAYEDAPLPIEEGQTISQPYIVALMVEAARLRPSDRVLEVGAGSGYAAAVLAEIACEVYTVERHEELVRIARGRLAPYPHVHLRHGDGTLGWAEHAPFDAILVAAGGPDAPRALLEQLTVGGRLVIPIGESPRLQSLVRFTRTSEAEYEREDLGPVQFVPLIGAQGWRPHGDGHSVGRLIKEVAEPIVDLEQASLASLLERIGDAEVVLLGEATHGTAEFYRMRALITRELILRRGFRIVAIEGDWPDAAHVDRFIAHQPPGSERLIPFSRFPTWMWRNLEVEELVHWLREYNREVKDPAARARFCGLDLYSMYTSMAAVIGYLDRIDPDAARTARERYGTLTPWQNNPAAYGRAVLTGRFRALEDEVVGMLRDLHARRVEYMERDGELFFDALQNARLVANAERYYRVMYYGSHESWNLRDEHMFDTLQALRSFHGGARVVVWEHNSHLGDAAATEMGARGELNVGHLCRTTYGDAAYAVGFGTDRGTVAAADEWEAPMRVMRVRPAHDESYERLCRESEVPAFLLPLRNPAREAVREELMTPRLERAIGVIYRPDTELQSHYFQAVLPLQFDEYIWFAETEAVHPLDRAAPAETSLPQPFGAA